MITMLLAIKFYCKSLTFIFLGSQDVTISGNGRMEFIDKSREMASAIFFTADISLYKL